MTRLLIILLVLFFCNSCKKSENKEYIDELLIFGYSGFCYKDSINQIYPSDEIWYNDSVKLEYDSSHLDIRQYFEFKKNSFINVAIRKPRKSTEYFSIDQLDTVDFEELINKTLLNKKFKTKYSFNDTTPRIYDGWSYTLYWKTNKNKAFFIYYIPDKLPDSLRILHNYVEKIILKENPEIVDKYEYSSITIFEAKKLFINHPPPPIIDKSSQIIFKAPLITNDEN